MKPEQDKGKDPRDYIITAIGTDRYLRLMSLFKRREI
jgi:hypothetical protein